MDNITILEGHELASILLSMKAPGVHTVRINQREDGIAIKVNSGTWSPTIGRRADAGGY